MGEQAREKVTVDYYRRPLANLLAKNKSKKFAIEALMSGLSG
jgi:uncharacterized protein (DUF2249 family)